MFDKDSEISFDLNSNHGPSTPISSPDTSQHSLQPIQNPFSQPATQPDITFVENTLALL